MQLEGIDGGGVDTSAVDPETGVGAVMLPAIAPESTELICDLWGPYQAGAVISNENCPHDPSSIMSNSFPKKESTLNGQFEGSGG